MQTIIDKVLHFLVGFFIFTCLQFLGVYAMIVVLILGLGKEIYDQIKYHGFDYTDLVCTIAGGFAGYWIMLVYI